MRVRTFALLLLLGLGGRGAAQAPPELALGRARLEAGDWDGARLVLLRALPAAADDPAVHSALARAYSELGEDVDDDRARRQYYERALEHARRGLELAPGSAQAHLDVAVVTGKIAAIAGARTKLRLAPIVADEARAALRIDPRAWQAHHVLGQWHLEIASVGGFKRFGASLLGGLPDASVEEAIAHFEKARALAPESIRNALGLGRAYAEADRVAEAQAELRRGLSLPAREPRDPALQREIREELEELDS